MLHPTVARVAESTQAGDVGASKAAEKKTGLIIMLFAGNLLVIAFHALIDLFVA